MLICFSAQPDQMLTLEHSNVYSLKTYCIQDKPIEILERSFLVIFKVLSDY